MLEQRPEKEILESVLEKLRGIETELTAKHSGNNKTKYKIFALFSDIRKFLNYRKVLYPCDISKNGLEWRCRRCENLISSDISVDAFEFCPICGQRINEEGTFENYIINKEDDEDVQ